MEIYISILCLLILLNIIFAIIFRPRSRDDLSSLSGKIEGLQSNIREDFRINREEHAAAAKENRQELNATLKDFKSEMADTLRAITDQTQRALDQINRTLEEKITALISRSLLLYPVVSNVLG